MSEQVQPPQQVQSPQVVVPVERSGMATAGLVLGIVSAVLAFVPILGLVTWVTAPLAIIFSALSLKSTRRGFAIAGLALGGIALIIAFLWVVFFGWAASQAPTPVTSSYAECMRENGQLPIPLGGEPASMDQGFWHGFCKNVNR